VCNDGSGSRLGRYDMITYPGSRPSTPELKPLLPGLLFILSTRWFIRLLDKGIDNRAHQLSTPEAH
jgi:hypothetical protein